MSTTPTPEPTGRLQLPHLYNYWQRTISATAPTQNDSGLWDLDCTLRAGLNFNVLETTRFLNTNPRPTFDEFESWIIATNNGTIDAPELDRLRRALSGKPVSSPIGSLDAVPGLTAEQLAHWDQHGYLIVPNAVAPSDRDDAAAAIYEFLDASPDQPDTWYSRKFGISIWVPLLRHPAFLANRRSPRLLKAFAQLWRREDLWATVDQGGLNPPERPGWTFPGPHIHWDESIAPPHHFGTQGILYLTDTPAEQGAFSCIPGFHRRLDDWLASLPAGANPHQAIRHEPGFIPISGRAGDLIIWHQMLPHGSSPNRGKLPRIVQYISLRPTRWQYTSEWK